MTDKTKEVLKLALDWIEGNGKYDAAKRIAQTIREALAEESAHESELLMNDENYRRKTLALVNKVDQEESSGTEQLAQQQEPVATLEDFEQEIYENTREFVSRNVMEWMFNRYYTSPPASKPLDGVLVPLNVLEAAESSLGSFCSDYGWSDKDMQNMDNLSAYIAQHKAAHGIKENT